MKFTENLLTNIQLSKMLHLEISNITKAVTKHLPVNKTCQHVPTLNPHVRLQHHAIRIHHQMKIISLLWHKSSDVTLKIIWLSDICSATRLILRVLFSDDTLCIFLSCLKALCLQNMQAVQSISEALDCVTIVKLSSFDDGFWLHDAEVGQKNAQSFVGK
jgi:hypothetical protein